MVLSDAHLDTTFTATNNTGGICLCTFELHQLLHFEALLCHCWPTLSSSLENCFFRSLPAEPHLPSSHPHSPLASDSLPIPFHHNPLQHTHTCTHTHTHTDRQTQAPACAFACKCVCQLTQSSERPMTKPWLAATLSHSSFANRIQIILLLDRYICVIVLSLPAGKRPDR